MGQRGRVATFAVVAMMAALGACDAPATRVRAVHASRGVQPIELWVAGQPRAGAIAFGDSSGWIIAAPGDPVELRTVGGLATVASGVISGTGDHVVSLGAAGSVGAMAIASLPGARGRGVELVLVGAGTALTYRLEVPDRPLLVAEAPPGLASSLVLPAGVALVTLRSQIAEIGVTSFVIDDAMRAAGRVLLIPAEQPDVRGLPIPALVAIDPRAPRERSTWIVAQAPRVHLLQAIAGGGVALRLAGGDPVAPCRPPTCVLHSADVTGGSALVEIVASGSDTVHASLELSDLVAGERRLVVALGDADGDPPLRLLELPVREQLAGSAPVTTVVHAAPRLGPLAISSVAFSDGGYRLLRDPLAPGESFEWGGTFETVEALGVGEAGGPVRASATLATPSESSIIVLTSQLDSIDRAEAIQIPLALGLPTSVATLEAP